ncbi:zinc finger bed domain-containing protein 1-like protein [Lasius niger]|uniref:Zinc finger bed domain-containing protein 1-like protein n=1 Tax=Lasius niger TaxID=67767 RepID=A0A0J7KMS2_LASNI|nr:zinc finger bed domain-containing protein 1-like protein [Lasius niger]
MGKHGKSWVWQYAKKRDNKAYCNICSDDVNNELSCLGGSTGAIGNYLQKIHGLHPQFKKRKLSHDMDENVDENEENMDNSDEDSQSEENLVVSNSSTLSSSATPCSSILSNKFSIQNRRKRHRRPSTNIYKNERLCSAERSEIIDQSLTKMIATTQLPLSFVSCPGFVNFMSVIEPNYKICKETTLKKRLNNLYTEVKDKIREELKVAMIERHTATNLSDAMGKIFRKWEISEKALAVVTENTANIVNAVRDTIEIQEQNGLTCAAHTLQLVVNEALAYQEIQEICKKAGKLGTFSPFNVATTSLQSKQAQLNMKLLKLIQSVKTRWNSTFEMLEN